METQMQLALHNLWKAARANGRLPLFDNVALAVIRKAGYAEMDAADILHELVQRGDVRELYNRDLATYQVVRDEFGFYVN